MHFKDLKKQYEMLKPGIDAAIGRVLSDSAFILGKEVEELEAKLAAYTGRNYCVTCGSGTDALVLALMACGIGPGDAVFVPDFTFFATAEAVSLLGAVPVFIDIDPVTFNMDPDALEYEIRRTRAEGALTPKAVIPVDLFGLPADYARIRPLAECNGLAVIEDGAQGFGGRIRRKKACSFGDLSVTSFFPTKPLGCYGDGGAVFTDDANTASLLRSLRAHGRSAADKYDNVRIGMNSRLDTVQAAVLLQKLQVFETELENVRNAAKQYTKRLGGHFTVPLEPAGVRSAWAEYTILLRDGKERAAAWEALTAQGIPSMVYYPKGLHQQAAYAKTRQSGESFPHTCDIADRCLSLPIHPYLADDDIERVAKTLLDLRG